MIVFIVLGITLFSSLSLSAFAWSLDDSEGSVEAYYLYNYENGMVMASKAASNSISASSTVKMMTACIALESDIPRDRKIIITNDMISGVNGRFMGLKSGDTVTFEDLLYCMICASFNDATHAIALTVCNTLEEYVSRMNDKALELGMDSTFYVDVTGISSSSRTSVNDLRLFAEYLSKNDEYLKITSTKNYQLSSVATCDYLRINNRSSLLGSYNGLCNFNTGSGSDTGDCAVLYLKNEKLSFIAIVMNAASSEGGNTAEIYAKRLLHHALYDYSSRVVFKANRVIDSLPVKYSISTDGVSVYPKEDVYAYLSKDASIDDSIEFHYYLNDFELVAPLREGDEVGMLVVTKNGRFLASSPIVVKENVERNSFLFLIELAKRFFSGRVFILSLVFFVILTFAYYYYNKYIYSLRYKNSAKKNIKYYKR